MGLVIKSDGSGTSRELKLMGKRARNIAPLGPSIGRLVSSHVSRQFVTEGAAGGTPWRPLKPAYRAWKISHGYGRKILVQTGEMKASFTSRPMDIEEYHSDRLRFGSSNKKAVWHHNGTHRHGEQINPARPILVVTPELVAQIKHKVARWIAKGEG